ncbi:MAG: polysaccharide biosynthesis/export family protein [Acidobacteria bacterium]|nr:polysaccharide biosynthesis/export family protein [Acidobacteriota bacterium]
MTLALPVGALAQEGPAGKDAPAARAGPEAGADAAAGAAPAAIPAAIDPGDSYVIGPGDVLSVRFWRQTEISSDVVVRPDGKVSLQLLDDVQAAGLTPIELRDRIAQKAERYFEDTQVTVIVKEVNSRRVFITGMVAKPGPYPLTGPLTVLQLIATAGGLLEYADAGAIVIVRNQGGTQQRAAFNYDRVKKGDNLDQNVELVPGDTVVVP